MLKQPMIEKLAAMRLLGMVTAINERNALRDSIEYNSFNNSRFHPINFIMEAKRKLPA